ncbi:cupin domain-containing protein [Conexibacter woesei]|uniref:Cupin 2 conserved barrel domain protein n=1 Tax=Conexibacter woesei (strain DSM 14684 / CCUG 47730 / CIP 108061 / JCM 11494 / NBRC 100937 / ID131577) TaxID=469383 RepID=D3F4U4_CONWI|nr:cupin domain-containing protein [Conexibacter woesei]ADB52551.1 Cupin 2 conserved barrel domain protein [Conexibacter woesei DSM 14684]
MGPVTALGVTVVPSERVEKIELPGDSWSRMVVTARTAGGGNVASLGYSVFTPGTALTLVKHETEEFAYVLSGSGELRLDGADPVAFAAGDGIFIPAGVWHAVVNTCDEDVAMVFGFPHPDYPPTARR